MINGNMRADVTQTVQDFIALRTSDDVTYYNYSILEYLNGYDMFVTNLLYDYDDEIQDLIKVVKLTDVERAKYRYKPYLFAYDVYGSTEYKFIVMMLNGIIDPKEFDFNRVKVVSPADLSDLLGRIESVNDEYMNRNNSQLKEDFKNNDGNSIWIE